MFFIINGSWAKWTFSQLMLFISKGKTFGQRELKRRDYIENLIFVVIFKNVPSVPFFKSKNLVPVLSKSLHYFFWHLKRKLFCLSVKKRFNVFIFLWCLLPLQVSITIANAALACSFVMWIPHIQFFCGEITFLKLLKSCQSWGVDFIELILNNNLNFIKVEESWEVWALPEFSQLISYISPQLELINRLLLCKRTKV